MSKSKSQVALIVGAGDATGGAIAKRFAREGYAVCATRRDRDKLQDLVREIEGSGGTVHPFGSDARKTVRLTRPSFARPFRGLT